MTVTGRLRGHKIRFDEARDEWLYADTSEPTVGNERICNECRKPSTPEGHDACLGTLPGVKNACCGHGDPEQAYVQHEDGRRVGGLTF